MTRPNLSTHPSLYEVAKAVMKNIKDEKNSEAHQIFRAVPGHNTSKNSQIDEIPGIVAPGI